MSLHGRRSAPREISVADDGAASTVASILRRGGVVALPTDTVYGYAVAVDRDDAIERLYALKQRPTSKAIPVLLSDSGNAAIVAHALPPRAVALADKYWPGGLTMVVDARDHLHPYLTSGEAGSRTVAIRVPDHPFIRDVIATLGGVLAVTSANRSGETPALTAAEIDRNSAFALAAIVDGGRVAGGIASTIVRVSNGNVEILRAGAIPAADILSVFRPFRAAPEPNHPALV
jgi:L-threonylcarbamoyladenylate synthase